MRRSSRLRLLPMALLAVGLPLAACSSSRNPPPAGGAASACGDGYLAAVNGSCPKGTCVAAQAGQGCCGSQCATCEDKGLVSTGEGGTCPAGTCVSGDLTVALTCCDACPGTSDGSAPADASADDSGDGTVDGAAD
ncbi:MAG TPA: hypothetical protein VIF09_08815 [Polyangiaceae bacterium]|jgi:hypothetical protein